MLDAHVDALLEDASVHQLVNTNAHGHFRDVKDDTGASVVVLVWHTLVDGRVREDVHIITNLHGHEVLGEVGQSVLAELLLEHAARARSPSERVGHLE